MIAMIQSAWKYLRDPEVSPWEKFFTFLFGIIIAVIISLLATMATIAPDLLQEFFK